MSGDEQIREEQVEQAVAFLRDPRVQASNIERAADFLRSKSLSDAELREALRRSGLNTPHYPTVATVRYPRSAERQSSGWIPLIFGIAAAAGVYSALKEVIASYVLPMIFPQVNTVNDAQRRVLEENSRRQERQIGKFAAFV